MAEQSLQQGQHQVPVVQVTVRQQAGQEQQKQFMTPVVSNFAEHKLEQLYGPGELCLEGTSAVLAATKELQPSQRYTYNVFAAAAPGPGRGSDDASAKNPGGSPPKPNTTSVTTVALADGTITLGDRFPGIMHAKEAVEAVKAVLAPEAADVLPKAVVQTALRVLTASQLSTEAARVQVAGLVLTDALLLLSKPQPEQKQELQPQPQQAASQSQQGQPLTYDGDSLADGLSISEQVGHQAQLGFEQHIHAGSFRGRVELQVVCTTLQGAKLFAGAVEVKQDMARKLVAHIEQAKKEAFAMWCHNALRGRYDPVWVVLTDLSQVLRVTYEGHNVPRGPGKPYKDRMPCADVRGVVRQTNQVPFMTTTDSPPFVHKVWDSGVLCFVGGLLQGQEGPITAQELQQRSKRISEEMSDLAEAVTEQQRPTKRSRGG